MLLALVFPASAEAVTIDSPNPIYQRWADAAKVPTPDGTIAVIEHTDQPGDACAPALGCTDGSTIWLETWPSTVRATFLHELGHVYAFQHPMIAAFEDEVFAQTYSLCARRWRFKPTWELSVGSGLISGGTLNVKCAVIRSG